MTRPRPGVDRMASAWLITGFIDPKASFGFVERPGKGDVPFDMFAGEFSHQGSRCTFEVLAERFALQDPAVAQIGRIVHDLDMKDGRYATPEGTAIGRMIDGLQQLHVDDRALLQHGIDVFDALASSFRSSDPSRPPRKART